MIEEVLVEVDAAYRMADCMRDARIEFYYVTVRRGALARLKFLVGDDAYNNGDWPPPVPVWRFEER